MSFDLNIVIVKQEKSIKFNSVIDILTEEDTQLKYNQIWRYMSSVEGKWYSLGQAQDDFFSALPIIDTEFDQEFKDKICWIDNEEILSNLTPLIVNPDYMDELIKLIHLMIKMSPDRTILFMARYQGGETEIIKGVIPKNKFIKLMCQEKILFNTCYIVSDID